MDHVCVNGMGQAAVVKEVPPSWTRIVGIRRIILDTRGGKDDVLTLELYPVDATAVPFCGVPTRMDVPADVSPLH